MLGADGELEGFGGGGSARGEVESHLLGVVEFIGEGRIVDSYLVGVFGVGGIDLGKGFGEPRGSHDWVRLILSGLLLFVTKY